MAAAQQLPLLSHFLGGDLLEESGIGWRWWRVQAVQRRLRCLPHAALCMAWWVTALPVQAREGLPDQASGVPPAGQPAPTENSVAWAAAGKLPAAKTLLIGMRQVI